MVGEFLNPWGSLVQVSWPLIPFSGSVHSKAKMSWLLGARSKLKKASFKSRTVYQVWVGGNELRRVYGFGTIGCTSVTHLFTSHKSWIGR